MNFLASAGNLDKIEWMELQPDEKYIWITEGMHPEFATFPPLGTKEAKSERTLETQTIFRNYGGGVKTNRDEWVYDFDRRKLSDKITRFIDTYDSEVDRWKRRSDRIMSVDDFVTYDDKARFKKGQRHLTV